MIRRLYVLVFVTTLSVAILGPCRAAAGASGASVPAPPASLRSAKLLQSVNKAVSLEGYYYDGSIPMIVDDMDRVRAKVPLPSSCYVPIVGSVPSSVRSGDRITITGTLFKPGSGEKESIGDESAAVRISGASAVKLVNSTKRLSVQALNAAATLTPAVPVAGKYAVLMGGGYSPASEGPAFRNGMLAAKQLLLFKGYPPGNIFVLYGNGQVPIAGLAPVIPFTKANINYIFSMLAAKVKNTDTLYVMVSANGGGLLTTQMGSWAPQMYYGLVDTNGDEKDFHSEAALHIDINHDGDMNDVVKVDETFWVWPGQPMSDDEFRIQVNKVQHYAKMIIEMDQSFSGGFIRDLTAPRRMIISSVGSNMLSWNEPSNQWDGFTPWWLGAFQGHRPWSSVPVPADANGNGKVSIVEAYNAARLKGIQPGVAGYEDNGVWPGWSGPMPYGGDGVLGLASYL
jgi:hypothetical protein